MSGLDVICVKGAHDAERVRHLTRRMTAGDEDAFREFHALYSDRLYRFLLVLTRGGDQLARELCQSAMLHVVRSIREFGDEKHFWSWLTSIARNLFIDALRKTKIVPIANDVPGIEPWEAGEERAALLVALEESLKELDFEERQLIDDYYFEGRDQESIAEARFTTRKAVESRLARIRAKVRGLLLRKLRYEK